MQRQTYSASFAPVAEFGDISSVQDCGVFLNLYVYCSAASTSPGSGVQVTWTWNDGFNTVTDDTIISLDSLAPGVLKKVPMWLGLGTSVTLEATLVGDGQFGINWEVAEWLN